MSRPGLAIVYGLLLAHAPASAQQASDPVITTVLENGKKLTTVEKKRACPEPGDDDTIIVCADPDADQDQRVFKGRPGDPDRIRRGEAISTTKASQCIGSYPACPIPHGKGVGVGFGYVPPPVIPFEEFMKGLPEPDMVVPEESDAKAAPAPKAP